MKASEYIHIAIKPKTHRKLLKVQRELQRNQEARVTKSLVVENVLDFYLELE